MQLDDTMDLEVAVRGQRCNVMAILDAPRPSGGCGTLLRFTDLLRICGKLKAGQSPSPSAAGLVASARRLRLLALACRSSCGSGGGGGGGGG